MKWKGLPLTARVLALAAAYFGAAKLGLALAFQVEQITAVWPPTGIALTATLLFGYRIWPGIALGAFFANFTAPDETLLTACGIAAGNTLEALTGAWLLHRVVNFENSMERLRDVLGLVCLAAGCCTMISATIGVTSLCLTGVQPWSRFGSMWTLWWLGDGAGAVIVAPLLLTWTTQPKSLPRPGRVAEAAVLMIMLSLLSLLIFTSGLIQDVSRHPLEYTVFPFVIWASLRFGQPGTTAVTFIASGVAIWGTVHGYGPFAGGTGHENLIFLQTFMTVVAVTALLLSAAIAERKRADALVRQDVLELRRLDNELRQKVQELAVADRRKDEFLATLSHELRNPLAPIHNAIHLLRFTSDNRKMQQARAIMERQLMHLVRLVDDLLDVSRITQNKLALRKERIELSMIIQNALEATRHLIEKAEHGLTVTLPRELTYLEADPVRLTQILTNLLNNAIKYSERKGRIWITAERQREEVVIRVRDNGIGIDAEQLPQLFEMFSQARPTLERSNGGLGIGLALARGLVELHGGRVEAHSAGPGKGSEFIVRLPITHGPVREPPKRGPVEKERDAYPLRVLVVDDNKDSADSLAMLLRQMGHETETAYDGVEGVKRAAMFQPEVVFLDIGLPNLNGYEAAWLIRQQEKGKDATLIALTGWGQEEDKRRALEAGCNHHLTKPALTADLEKLLKQVSELRSA